MNVSRPNRSILDTSNSPILERSLLITKKRRNLKNSIFWGSINVCLLAILLYDVSFTCSYYLNFYNYVEYVIIGILTFNVFYHLVKVIKLGVARTDQVTINLEQKKLLGVRDSDPSFRIVKNTHNTSSGINTPVGNMSSLNSTNVSWKSNITQNDSLNYSLSSSWTYQQGSPDADRSRSGLLSNRSTPLKVSTFQNISSVEMIKDDKSLEKYLKEHEKNESVNKLANKTQHSSNLLSSFWSHPVTKTAKDMSSFLKRCQYQLSTQSPNKSNSNSPSSKVDEHGNTSMNSQASVLEVWARINVDVVALTQWNENLRIWVTQTILERLVKEFDTVNHSLASHGMAEIKIGLVGLDRLRKTAQMIPVMQYIPSLTTLIPFLEVHANQEYLEKRIRELAKGGCMSEFKWNGGSSYNGKEWDDSLPTDCAIIMHLLASYMDTQLMPMPNKPDTKAFSGHHYIKFTDKMPELTPSSLFIHQASEKPPHYRVIVGEKVYEMIKGYNNLFHSFLFFIYHVNKVEHGMLGRVNLGKAGVNMLWIIDQ
ncbi:unnamed protein product [Brassicogethes aeneus]|uniref:Transmembrane protein 209 n=1 Tax=Brassicogethes aeneus TaxID=1431903 RepID=A0A9P0AXU5_BRAAE|nr:unnamed protein product [Brassicogethes aeneus]